MALTTTYYGTVDEADAYFANRLHETAWSQTATADKPRALLAARRVVDALNYKGSKHTVYLVLEANAEATAAEIQAAEAAQALEFPRGDDTVVPEDIRVAAYEIAYALLDGKDPELELENLAVTGHSYGGVRTGYNRDQVPIEHIINMVPSSLAWRLLKPYLRDDDALRLSRVS